METVLNVAFPDISLKRTVRINDQVIEFPNGPLAIHVEEETPPIRWSDFLDLGSFRIPMNRQAGDVRFGYAPPVVALRPGADGALGTLVAVSHPYYNRVAEVDMPAPAPWSRAATSTLPAAKVVQQWAAPLTGFEGPYQALGGLAVVRRPDGAERLYWQRSQTYNVAATDHPSLGHCSLDFADFDTQGVWNQPAHHNAAAGYLANVPPEDAESLEGHVLLSGRGRTAGRSAGAWGPSAWALRPWDEQGCDLPSGAEVSAKPLLHYPLDHPVPHWNGACDCGGVAWVRDGGRAALVFSVVLGLGTAWYGAPKEPPAGGVVDTVNTDKGYHAPPYRAELWFYDLDELREVLAGQREPWQVLPYELAPIQDRLAGPTALAPAILWDHDHKLLLVYEAKGWRTAYEPAPAVHVFALQG